MKTKIFLAAIFAVLTLNLFSQDLRIQQGASSTIKMSSGSSATDAKWSIDAGAQTSGVTFTHTWNESVGNHNLDVIPQSANTCQGATSTYIVEVFLTLPPTDPNITAIALANACPITTNNPTSSSVVTLTNANWPAGSAYTVTYKIGLAGTETTVPLAAGATTFTVDASSIAAGANATVYITKFKITGSPAVVLASGPSGTLNVDAVPTITGVE